MRKPEGQRGSWFAKWNGVEYPCVHKHYVSGSPMAYRDPYLSETAPWPAFVEAITKLRRVIVTEDYVTPHEGRQESFTRTGYVALYDIDNVRTDDGALTFKFTNRVESFS